MNVSDFALVPWPRRVLVNPWEPMKLTPRSQIAVDTIDLKGRGELLRDEIQAISGLRLDCVFASPRVGDISLVSVKGDPSRDFYSIHVAEYTTVTGNTDQAVADGTATLTQLLDIEGDVVALPAVEINDESHAIYRGLLVDVARRPHSVECLRDIIRLCRFYKIRFLQLHLTDDEAWTFPSETFPRLGEANWNGVARYTRDELLELVGFGDALGVTLIPEIDLPGHSAAMRRTMPEMFDPRGLGNVNVATGRVYDAIETLIGEVSSVFRSAPYFHIGADEVIGFEHVFQDYSHDPLVRSEGITSADDLFTYFLRRSAGMIAAQGKRAVAWEGRRLREKVDDIVMMPWANRELPLADLVGAGYDTINAASCPLYLVEGKTDVSPEFLYTAWDRYTWGRYEGEEMQLSRSTMSRIAPTDLVIGAQMCSWENPEEFELQGLRPLVPAFSEKLWRRRPHHSFERFAARTRRTDARLGAILAGSC